MPDPITGRTRVAAALGHRHPDRVPVDFGSTSVTGLHVSAVAALRRYYGLEPGPVKVIDPGAMLGEVAGDLQTAMGVDTKASVAGRCVSGSRLTTGSRGACMTASKYWCPAALPSPWTSVAKP